MRATVPNPKDSLIAGQLLTVVLESGTPEQKIVIPQSALIADQQGVYIFVVENGKAVVRRVKTGDASGAGIVVEAGFSGGEQVIIEGLQSIKPGTPVQASPLPPAPDRS